MRAHALRFTPAEAQTLLEEIANLNVQDESLQALLQETEGWAAALQLALTSLMQRQGTSIQAFIENFRASNRYAFDYLSEEVLATQPPEVQSFLLRTSILPRLNPDLCNALLDIDHSRQILETLEAQNLFILALDERCEWYRYHHLFRDFLQERLQRQQGDTVRSLHLRAVAYFKAAGDIDRAIDHCRVSGAVEKLIDLVEQAAPAHLARGRSRTVQGWLETVPAEILAGRPWLMLYRGTILAMHGQSDAARLLLLQTREAFTAAGDELGEGRALNQLCRVAFFEGRYEEALELNHEAPRRMAWTDHEGRSRAFREQAELWIYLGRPMQAIEESLVHTQHLSDKAVMAERTIIQGVAYRIAGRLSEAMRTMKRGLNMLDTPEALGSTLLTHNWGWPIWSVGS